MSQRYNDNTKRSQRKENQPRILKIYVFYWKIQERGSGQGDRAAGVTYLSMRISRKSCCIFCLKITTTLLGGSRKGAVGA